MVFVININFIRIRNNLYNRIKKTEDKMRYLEYLVVLGDGPPGLIIDDIKELANPEDIITEDTVPVEEEKKASIWEKTEIHHLSKSTYVWNFSLIYRERSFDIIKWKTSSSWKERKKEDDELLMEKALFIGADAGVFFISIDDEIDENFTKLADMMDVFREKTKGAAPFLVYAVIENKEKIAELKTNKDMLKNVADVKKWTTQHGGEFRLENLKEIRMNLTHLISDYSHFILSKLQSKTNYPNLKLGEVHYMDYEDLAALKEIEDSLVEQTKAGQTVDDLLSEQFFELFEKPEFQEEKYIPPPEPEPKAIEEPLEEPEPEEITPPPSKIKMILREIRLGIRRQCPKCFNNERNKIREVVDRTHIIMENPNVYGFKFVCGMCGNEWKTKKDWEINED